LTSAIAASEPSPIDVGMPWMMNLLHRLFAVVEVTCRSRDFKAFLISGWNLTASVAEIVGGVRRVTLLFCDS
jgi:hypothetical protein